MGAVSQQSRQAGLTGRVKELVFSRQMLGREGLSHPAELLSCSHEAA